MLGAQATSAGTLQAEHPAFPPEEPQWLGGTRHAQQQDLEPLCPLQH